MTTQLKQVETRRLYQHIADQIRSLIRSGGFAPGTRLPAERDLAQQLGVSRPSVREALIALEIAGSVEIRQGSGVYVCRVPDRSSSTTAAMGESPSELMQARAVLEGSVIVLATALITPDGLAQLRETLDAMCTQVKAGLSPLEHDRAFHVCIAEMSGNSVLVRMVAELFDERHSPISSRLSGHAETSQTWQAALEEHEAIYRALEERDPLAAQAAIRRHLKASEARWIEAG
ncbi:FadR/GntR family transcriptional regulator [Paraburkholderia fynbosensis]|uniref:L-lactate dehydrogenase operon regulatory protein n=1 Tax=Paraburkholderia fynbosensis TaxID=1200993 RepID=A0A6J5GEF8_9BURK|nr:FadR/GntR family transcriptional regulator [Paraburkholderia fynbosensis]CAB3796085.1 Putative L-lactate dehydrogenase operon regulatory protein [Paraburkholderia fynbosensis]